MYDNKQTSNPLPNDKLKVQAGIFLAVVGSMSAIIGFSSTLAAAKKQDTKYFNKGIVSSVELHTTGINLALRALGWGTFYAFSGTGILFYSIWKLSGAQNFKEFRYKIGSILPKIPKNESHDVKTEFSGLNDLLEHLQTRK